MRVKSLTAPASAYVIEPYAKPGYSLVWFYANIEPATIIDPETGEQESGYAYDVYSVPLVSRPDLESDIASNIAGWLSIAIADEHDRLAREIRAARDALLSETDYIMRDDYPATTEYKQQIAAYCNSLRDIPEQETFPYSVVWPEKPASPTKATRELTPVRVDGLEEAFDALIGGESNG